MVVQASPPGILRSEALHGGAGLLPVAALLGRDGGLGAATAPAAAAVATAASPSPWPIATVACAVACLAYLVPAGIAVCHQRHLHGLLFFAAAALGALRHTCELWPPNGSCAWCPHAAREPLALSAQWSAQLSVLQAAFLVLGPEDPLLRKNGHDAPPSTVLFARVLPGATLAVAAALESQGGPRPQRGALLAEILLASGCAAFWMGSARRRSWARDALLRARFWQRALRLAALPALGLLPLAALAAASASQALHAILTVGVASAVAAAVRTVLGGAVEVVDCSAANPLIVHWLLGASLAVLVPTMALVLSLDAYAHGAWRWATLSMASTTPASALVLKLAALPLVASAASAIWILESLGHEQEQGGSAAAQPAALAGPGPKLAAASAAHSWRSNARSFGCHLGYFSLVAGAAAAAFDEGTRASSALHVAFAVLFFAALLGCQVLVTLSSELRSPSGVLRAALLAALLCTMCLQLVLFIFVNQFIPNNYGIPHSIYALSEYTNLLIMAAMPLTWVEDVRAVLLPGRSPATPAGSESAS